MRPNTTILGQLVLEDPAQARALLGRTMLECGGNLTRAASALGMTRMNLHRCLRKLGMLGLPAEVRRAIKARFRVPAIGAA